MDHFDVAHDDEDRATFEAKTGVRLADLKGLRVLDAGCGGVDMQESAVKRSIVVGADQREPWTRPDRSVRIYRMFSLFRQI